MFISFQFCMISPYFVFWHPREAAKNRALFLGAPHPPPPPRAQWPHFFVCFFLELQKSSFFLVARSLPPPLPSSQWPPTKKNFFAASLILFILYFLCDIGIWQFARIEIEGQRGIRIYINHLGSLMSTIVSNKWS